jgi:hypothetical protein
VSVEAFPGFVAFGPRQVSFRLGTAVGKPIGRGRLFGLTALGPLSRGPQIDNVTHEKTLGGSQMLCWGHPGPFVWNGLRRHRGTGSRQGEA